MKKQNDTSKVKICRVLVRRVGVGNLSRREKSNLFEYFKLIKSRKKILIFLSS